MIRVRKKPIRPALPLGRVGEGSRDAEAVGTTCSSGLPGVCTVVRPCMESTVSKMRRASRWRNLREETRVIAPRIFVASQVRGSLSASAITERKMAISTLLKFISIPPRADLRRLDFRALRAFFVFPRAGFFCSIFFWAGLDWADTVGAIPHTVNTRVTRTAVAAIQPRRRGNLRFRDFTVLIIVIQFLY